MANPRWLDDEEQQAWRALASVLVLVPAALDAQLQRDADLTHFSYWVLAMLSETPGRSLRMSELAARSNSSPSRLSHVVGRLEERGWVRRERSDVDGRGNVATLTAAGLAKVRATAPGHVEEVRRLIFDRLEPAQVRQVGRACRSILAGIGAEAGDAGPSA